MSLVELPRRGAGAEYQRTERGPQYRRLKSRFIGRLPTVRRKSQEIAIASPGFWEGLRWLDT